MLRILSIVHARKMRYSCYGVVYHSFAGPVELAVVNVAAAFEQIAEHTAKLIVVGRLEEIQPSNIAEICSQLFRMPFA